MSKVILKYPEVKGLLVKDTRWADKMQSSPLLICRTDLWIGVNFSRCVPKDHVVLPAYVNLLALYSVFLALVFWMECSSVYGQPLKVHCHSSHNRLEP